MTILEWVAWLGIPSLFTIVSAIFVKLLDQGKKIKIIMAAYQATLKDRLMQLYHKAMKYGCISDDDIEMFEALYNAYHSLGKNGVMTSRHDAVLKLPTVQDYPNE